MTLSTYIVDFGANYNDCSMVLPGMIQLSRLILIIFKKINQYINYINLSLVFYIYSELGHSDQPNTYMSTQGFGPASY